MATRDKTTRLIALLDSNPTAVEPDLYRLIGMASDGETFELGSGSHFAAFSYLLQDWVREIYPAAERSTPLDAFLRELNPKHVDWLRVATHVMTSVKGRDAIRQLKEGVAPMTLQVAAR